MVYGYAALHRLYQIYDRRTLWNQLEKRYQNQNSDSKANRGRIRPKNVQSDMLLTGRGHYVGI